MSPIQVGTCTRFVWITYARIAMLAMATTNPSRPLGKIYVVGASKSNIVPGNAKKPTGPPTRKLARNKKKRYKKELKKYGKSTKKATVLNFKDKEEFEEWKRENNKDIEFVEAVNIPVTEEQRASMQTTKLSSKISSHRVVPEDVMRFSDKEKEDVRKKILPMVDDKVKELRKAAKKKTEPARQECPVPQECVEAGNLIGAMAGLSVEDGDFLHASEQLKELANNPNRVAELFGHCNTREELLSTVAGVLEKSKK